MKISFFIKTSRKELGLTQDQLAGLINKKRSNIALYESGRNMPPGDVILKIIQLRFPDLCLSEKHFNSECEKMQTLCHKEDAT